MKEYLFTESDMRSVAILNNLTTGFISAGTGLSTLALGLKFESDLVENLPTSTVNATNFNFGLCIVLAVICFLAGVTLFVVRRSELNRIASETQHREEER